MTKNSARGDWAYKFNHRATELLEEKCIDLVFSCGLNFARTTFVFFLFVLIFEGVMKSKIDKEIREKLASKHLCYVLITCDSPSKSGDMNVEMTYEGDPVLAAYLLQGAQNYFDESEAEEQSN